jgi:hypothetical protein
MLSRRGVDGRRDRQPVSAALAYNIRAATSDQLESLEGDLGLLHRQSLHPRPLNHRH